MAFMFYPCSLELFCSACAYARVVALYFCQVFVFSPLRNSGSKGSPRFPSVVLLVGLIMRPLSLSGRFCGPGRVDGPVPVCLLVLLCPFILGHSTSRRDDAAWGVPTAFSDVFNYFNIHPRKWNFLTRSLIATVSGSL
jgi:hypothetical protein